MKIAVFFDGAGLARLGLEQAGHECVGFERNPVAHHLSQHVGSGRSVLEDVRDVDLSSFDALWASPPCQWTSAARTQGAPVSEFADPLLAWSLDARTRWPHLEVLWVECAEGNARGRFPSWGKVYNAYQFGGRQNRNRVIGGHYPEPVTKWAWRKWFPEAAPAVTATEYKGCATDMRRASRFFGRRATLEECASLQGLTIPAAWYDPMPGYDMDSVSGERSWIRQLYTAIGNGVPVHMARAFGEAVGQRQAVPAAMGDLFSAVA